jgi:hypothetical protein
VGGVAAAVAIVSWATSSATPSTTIVDTAVQCGDAQRRGVWLAEPVDDRMRLKWRACPA